MINKLYTAKNGTPHVVRVLDVVREFTKGERMDNTAITQQVLLQRQKLETIGRMAFYTDDLSFKKFSIELEPFLDEYQEIDPPKQETFGEMLQNRFGDEPPIIFMNEGCKEYSSMKTGIKMRVTPEQSAKAQEIVFKNGGGWNTTGGRYTSFIDAPFLYLSEKRQLMMGTEEASFYEEPEIEVDADLFIRTNGTCEEKKLCSSEELKTIKEVLQDMEAPQKDDGAYDFNDFEFVEEDPISPSHYKIGGIETIDYIAAKLTPEEFKGYCKGNTIKYISRAGHKGREVEDYKKAAWYLDKLIGVLNQIKKYKEQKCLS